MNLREIAQEATPGPWGVEREIEVGTTYLLGVASDDDWVCGWSDEYEPINKQQEQNASHIAAWSPDRALAALDVIEKAKLRTLKMAGTPDYRILFPDTDISVTCVSTEDLEALRAALAKWDAL